MSTLKLSREDNGKLIEPRQGDVIIVSLPEKPTNGYRWTVDSTDQTILELQEETFRIAPEAGLGGGGTRTFTFRAISAGNINLGLRLWRKWAGDDSIIERYRLIMKILG